MTIVLLQGAKGDAGHLKSSSNGKISSPVSSLRIERINKLTLDPRWRVHWALTTVQHLRLWARGWPRHCRACIWRRRQDCSLKRWFSHFHFNWTSDFTQSLSPLYLSFIKCLLQVEGPGSPGSPQTFGRESAPTSPPQSPHSFLITPGSVVVCLQPVWFLQIMERFLRGEMKREIRCFNVNHFRTRVPQARTAERVGLQPSEQEAGLRLQPQLEPQQVLARPPKKLRGEPVWNLWNNLTPSARSQCNQWIFLSAVQC